MSKLNSAKAVFASSKASRRLRRSAWMLSAAVAAITLANPAHAQLAPTALPTGGTVVAGSASIGTPTPSSSLTVNQSTDRAVINWTSFDIGSAASVTFVQPSATSVAVNRVTGGGAPSEIAGQLNANGRVAILNPNGVLFAGTADVNVGSLIASTGDIDQNAFMSGGNLDITGATGGEIVVNGNINITAGTLGLAAFVAPTVRNSGVITATAGRVQLGGGTAFTLDLAGDGLLSIGVPASSALVQNNGQIFAEGGHIQMSAKTAGAAVDNLVNTGTLSVDSATMDNGTIVLEAVGGNANLSGTIAVNDRNSISRNLLISSDRGVNISGNLAAGNGTVNITAPHIYGTGTVTTNTALMLNISNNGTDTTGLGNYINDAMGVIGSAGFGTTIKLGAGTYRSGVSITKNDVYLDGQGVARIGWTSGIENAIDIWGDYVTVRNLEISGPATSAYTSFAWGSTNSRGIFVNRYADGVQLLNNNIHDIRTGIIVDGRNANVYLLDNTIDNTKSAISIQYTDGSNVTMTGNHGSTYGNEWGINLYLNGILQGDGVTILPSAGSLGANTPLAEQQRLLALRAANGNMEVQNQGYSALNRTAAYVSTTGSNSNQGSQLGRLATIQAGVNAVVTGGTVYVADGNYNLASSQLVINHGLSLIGASQAGVVIDGRAVSANGLGTISVLADNVSLSNFSLLGSQLSGGNYGIKVQPNPAGHVSTAGGTNERVSNFAISNVTVSGSRRAELDLNGVVGATITNFTANGQGTDGAGIQITDSSNVTLSGVHTLGNNWGGVALYQSNSASGYNAQTTNITIDAGQNNLEEANGLFSQDSSATQNFGTLNLAGFNYAIRNTGSRADASQFVWFQTSLGNATSFALALGAPTTSSIEGWNVSAGTNQFSVFNGMGITAALRDARAGATISVAPGSYTEGVTGVGYYGDAGSQTFGLYVAKDNITIRGVDAAGNTITSADDVAAYVTAAYQAGFGAQHFISGNGVTIEGLGFLPAATGDNKTVEVIGNAFTLRNSVIDNRGNETAANLYIDDFNDPSRTRLESFTITGNRFYGGTYASAMVVVASGAGRSTDASNRIFSDNYLYSDLSGMRGFQIQGYMPNTPWQQLYAGAVTVTNNSFDVDIPVRTVGQLSTSFDWNDVFLNNGNDFLRGGVLTYAGSGTTARATTTAGGDPDVRITSTIDASLARAQAGDTVRILDGTYVLGSQLAITTSVSLIGQSQAGTILDGRTVNNGGGLGTIMVAADNTTLSNFTLLGSTLSGGNYGIKVQPNPLAYAPSQRINNITISDVTVRGSRRAELDINGAVGVTITNFTADGAGTEGAGVQITDSANVTLTGVHTLGNNWGGVALYQTNRAGGYDGQTTNININAGQNQLDEANGLFAQLESTTQGFGQLNLTGYGYAVRNTGSRADGYQFTWFRTDLADATGWALGLGGASTSSIEGYTGTGFSNVFTVVNGLSIGAAARDVRTGGTINVGAGTYASGTAITTNGVSLLGAAGAKINASNNGDNGITINADGVTVSGFEIFGPADQSFVTYSWPTITRGIVVSNGADNVTVTGNNIHDVRNGILIDGRNANTALTNNVIDNTKSAISVQYTDGSNLTLSGNSEGTFGNEWGIITYLNGIWNGSTITASGGALGPNTPLSEQARLLALSAANNGMAVYNQGYSAANRTRAYVTTSGVGGAQGSQRTLLNLQGGLDAVVSGGTVYIGAGTYNENVSLDALRVLSFAGPVTVNSLTFGAGAAGTNIATDLTATGALSFAVGPVLTGNTVLTGDTISLGAITAAYGLTLNGTNGVSIGLADLASLSVTGSDIVTAGVTTSGAQSYTGDVTLNGAYDAGTDFTVTGLATLAADSTVSSGGTSSLGGVTGGYAFAVDGTSVVIGPVTGLTSLNATGATISSAGASTNGAQSYNGATTLNGAYSTSGAAFGVTGAATLGGDTTVNTAGGNAGFATVTGAHTLAVDAVSGAATFGAVSGLTSLSATGATIVTAGVATSGGQSYTGSTSLTGSYTTNGGGLSVQGNSTLTGATSIVTSGGTATLGTVNGAGNALAVDAGSGGVTLGGASGLTTLSATGATIATAGVLTNGTQSYTGATTLNGGYTTGGGAFTVTGGAGLIGVTAITTAGGDVGLAGGALGSGQLYIDSGAGTVTLGASSLGLLDVTGGAIVTSGVTTASDQSYTGATTLGGTYNAGGSLTVTGATNVAANTGITTGGNTSLGAVGGTGTLAINAGANSVTLGAVNGLASLSATGASIATSGAATNGAQNYTGATSLNGAYTTGGGTFAVNGAATTVNAVSVATSGGNASFGTVGGAGGLTVTAGSGGITLGAVNGIASLSATGASIATAGASTSGAQSFTGATTLNGVYNAASFTVAGATTLAGTTAVTTSGGNIGLGTVRGVGNPIINPFTGNLSLNAGSGSVTLGATENLGGFSATGSTIATNGVLGTGSQSYTGATSLNGQYSAGSSFTVNGATTLGVGITSVTTATGGTISFGTIGGAGSVLNVTASGGSIALGQVNGIGALNASASGGTVLTNGVTTTGNQTYSGATTLAGNYSAGGFFSVFLTTVLAGDTNVTTSGGAISLGTVNGTGNLTLNAGAGNVQLNTVSGIGALNATGAFITTRGATTTGAQTYTGSTTLNGVYNAGGAFTLAGGVNQLGGATTVSTANSAITLGTVLGQSNALTVNAGTGSVSLSGSLLASLTATGATISTAGVTSIGGQTYNGATSLNGGYSTGGAFTVNGATTIGAVANVATNGGNASFGTVGGTGGLTINAGSGNVTLGAVSGIASLSATGASIATASASTTGAQSFTGATTLGGTYAASSLAVNGATTLSGATNVTTSGNAGFGTVGGTGSLSVNAGSGAVTLGAVNGLSSLTASGASIATSGAATSGAQSYTGATSLGGAYSTGGAAFTVNGAATTVNAVSVATSGGNAGFGTVGGAGGLTVNAGSGNVTLGAVSGIASLAATGANIATAGASTTGALGFTGATTLNGSYAASTLTVTGATTLGGTTAVTTTGNTTLGTVGGTGGLTVNAGTGTVTLGAVSGIASLSATGANIATASASTTGAQSYTGATSLNGAYTTGGAAFTVTGATNLAGNTSVTSGNGAISLGAVDAAVAGSQSLTLNAGTGSVALGNTGATRRLGATSVNAGTTVLNGATYAANSLGFTGGTGATVRLTQGSTSFNTSLPGGAGGAITIAPDLIGTTNAQQNVTFTAGNGLTVNSGDVTIGNAGSDAIRLGTMTVTGHNFSGATVKLAGNFTSQLSGSQAFTSNTLDTLGSVNAIVAGNESGPIRAGGSVTIDAGGSGSGSIIAGGAVNLQYDGDASRLITSQGNVTVQGLGAIGGSVNAGGAVNLQGTTGPITSAVTATGPVSASTTSGGITSAITSNGAVTLGSTSGTIGGTITAGGPVAITTTSGGVTSNVTTPGTAAITSQTGTVNATVTGNGGVDVTTNGTINGSYTSAGTIELTTPRPIDVQVNGTVVTVTAPSGSVTGVFSEIHTTNTGTLVVNDQPVIGTGTADARQIIIDTFVIPSGGSVAANGEIQLPAGLALGLIAPAGNGQGGQRPAVVVNNVQRLGELLREGYTAIIIQLDESNLDVEEEVAGQ